MRELRASNALYKKKLGFGCLWCVGQEVLVEYDLGGDQRLGSSALTLKSSDSAEFYAVMLDLIETNRRRAVTFFVLGDELQCMRGLRIVWSGTTSSLEKRRA